MEEFIYSHGGRTFRGQLALPQGQGPHPGVMVMHDGQGVGEFVCRRAETLASMGYAALATDMFGEGRQHRDPAEGGAAVIALRQQADELRARILAAFEAFRSRPEVDAARIGAIGYCFGGQCVLELARSGADVKGVVSFHGTLTTDAPAQAGKVKAGVLALTGALDPFAPPADREAFEREMTAAGVDWQMTVYSLGKHGFTDPISDEAAKVMDGVGYSRFIDRLSWAEASAFLDLLLRD